MQRVMGGEFLIDNSLLQSLTIDKTAIRFSSGRHALSVILNSEHTSGGGIILVPDFLCDSVTRTIKEAGWNYEFYKINDDLQFNINELEEYKNADAILVINYFGMLQLNEIIDRIHAVNPKLTVIEDDVQAFFEYKKSRADYSFTSLRKCFPCPDGALINSKRKIKEYNYRDSKWSQYKFAGNILKNYGNEVDDSISLELLQKGEELLDTEYRTACSRVSQVIFSNIDFDEVAAKRKRNAAYLHDSLVALEIKHIYRENAVPLFIPILIKNRNTLRKQFFQNNIFTPVHWPIASVELNGNNDIYSKELSLICDQRYDIEDMERQIGVLKQFLDSEGKQFGDINI